ncbi:sensor domain-containing phosphodiesterase [Enterovibrio norvegicus]|uniref:EAL domain-containing protein n=1 Tax=Enterovibrio norvegicus TaxID=188144 RepID=A0A2N7L335_9GAMM|nr:EAL domain-containing protein [Enterovibrio norvegicus]PMN86808.1 EAL domain-containing protein [Enterovibrio norvegicus]
MLVSTPSPHAEKMFRRFLHQPLVSQCIIFLGLWASYYLSSFFEIEETGFFVISFVNAFMVATLFHRGIFALPAIFLAMLTHGLFASDLRWNEVLLFSCVLPIAPALTTFAYNHITLRIRQRSVPLKAGIYFFLFAIVLPIFNASLLFLVASTSFIHIDTPFIFFSSISIELTHLVITPLMYVALVFVFREHADAYMRLDRQLFEKNLTPWTYYLWLALSLGLVGISMFIPYSLLLFSICFFLLILVFMGLGRYGILRPMVVGAIVTLVLVYEAVVWVNNTNDIDENFLGLLEVLILFSVLAYIQGSDSIRSFMLNQERLRKERIDPYTGLYNLAQLKEDLSHIDEPVLVYLDLKTTMHNLTGIGHTGQAQFLRQLTKHFFTAQPSILRFYRPPFSVGLIYIESLKPDMNDDLVAISDLCDNFQFFWQGTSISLFSHTLHCCKLSNKDNVEETISVFCDQPTFHDHKIRWFDDSDLSSHKFLRLNTVQRALREDQFELYCQPYRNLKDPDAISSSFEVLLRLKQDNANPLEPDEFFPMINEFGLEAKLDKWVIAHTFEMLASQLNDWDLVNRCAINLTAKSLGDEGLSDFVIQKAKVLSIPLYKVCFEITESSAIENESLTIETVHALRKAGCKIALDDFGTGYASFSYLRRIPINVLKIDGEFVRNLPTNDADQLIVQSVQLLAENMRLTTVAEYVETDKHAHILTHLGIDFAQGFGIAKPRPLRDHIAKLNGE